jgi:hypothetical protein
MCRLDCLFITAALGLTACMSDSDIGQLELSLTGTATSGTTYRLRDAELTIEGVNASFVFNTEDDPTRLLITQRLDVGNYHLHVASGWRLERLRTDGPPETVEATLVSPDPLPFTIAADAFTPVVVRFRTRGEVVALAKGDAGISIDVEDRFEFALSQVIDGETVTCSAVSTTASFTECSDLRQAGRFFPNGVTCGPVWSTTNSEFSDTAGFCASLTGNPAIEVFYTCDTTMPRSTWINHVWGTVEDNGFTQHVRCFY